MSNKRYLKCERYKTYHNVYQIMDEMPEELLFQMPHSLRPQPVKFQKNNEGAVTLTKDVMNTFNEGMLVNQKEAVVEGPMGTLSEGNVQYKFFIGIIDPKEEVSVDPDQ